MKRTTISLPEDVADRLQREARRLNSSASAVIREALDEHFGPAAKKREIPFAALGRSEGPPWAEDEEALLEGFGEDSLGS